jgi:hypothetical protein
MSPKLKAKLVAAEATLAGALAALASGRKQFAKLEGDRASVVAELDQCEARAESNPGDGPAIARLQTLKEQLTRFDAKISKVETEYRRTENTHNIALSEALSTAMDGIVEWSRAPLHEISTEAMDAFRPYFRDQIKLELAVKRCDKIRSFESFIITAGRGPDDKKPERVINLLDGIIAGKPLPWTWPEWRASAPAPDEHEHATA